MHPDHKIREIFIESCLEQLKNIEARILDLEHAQSDQREEQITRIFRAAHSIKGDAGSMGLEKISAYAHSIENVLQLVREGLLQISQQLVNELLHAFDVLKNSIANAGGASQEALDAELDREAGRLNVFFQTAEEQERQQQSPATQDSSRQNPPDAEDLGVTLETDPQQTPEESGRQSAARPETEVNRTAAIVDRVAADEKISRVTIPALQLDILVDRVGELAIAQTRLSRLARDERDSRFLPVAEEIEALCALLRDQVLGLRLLPLEVSYGKLRRLVRDLCAELGKKAEFVMIGQNTELDKKLIEELNTPLIHLLRNAVDHGMEPPHMRQYLGKAEQGRIEVAASQLGGEVLIEVKDDGKGIEAEKLYRLALDKGLLDPDEELSGQQKLELIFLPGLTTAEKVSGVSGRGVGMDAVKASVQSLRGKIDVQSAPGKGTTFSIQLPISMAIIDCLRVSVAGADYFMHLDYVEECLELPAAATRGAQPPRGMSLRGEHLPLVCLREFFDFQDSQPDAMQVVVVHSIQGRLGIIVDAVVGQQQAVLRHLGPAVGKVPGILGATVTEHGAMGLILDMPGLARVAYEQERRRWG